MNTAALNAFRTSKAIYDALPPGVSPQEVGFVSHDGTTEFFVPGGPTAVTEMGLSLEDKLVEGLLTLHEEDGYAIVTVRGTDLEGAS